MKGEEEEKVEPWKTWRSLVWLDL